MKEVIYHLHLNKMNSLLTVLALFKSEQEWTKQQHSIQHRPKLLLLIYAGPDWESETSCKHNTDILSYGESDNVQKSYLISDPATKTKTLV